MPEIEIQYLPFVVNDTPYCFWDTDIRQRNIEFINSIDASYFSHMATVHANSLDSEQRQYAAIALRTEYYHSLETLFSLLCAIVQAPDCIIGWLLKYQNRDLCSVVKKIDEYKPLLYRLDMKQVSWEYIADEVHKLKTGDEQQDSYWRQSFGHLWRRFAKDFLDEDIKSEYNSIKHGFRVSMGGFRLTIGAESIPGVPAPSEAMRSLGGSEFGSSFFVTRQLQKDNFEALRHSLNWEPGNMAHALTLVAMSIQNVLTYLKFNYGIQQTEARYIKPENDTDFNEPWASSMGVNKFGMTSMIDENSIIAVSKKDILASYEDT